MDFSKMFKTEDGRNYLFTFALVSTLFLLWGTCNGMLDVLNKHFQNSLHISKAQSAFVQFANYMGYFLMAIPAGMLARKFGYKAGIITGLVLIALGAFWFIPASQINTFPAFLAGLFIIAIGLACLETVANPYTTVLGHPDMGAARINLAQSCNGIGWIFGPIIGGQIILSSTSEVNRSNASLFIPYLIIGAIVVLIAVVFFFSKVPDIVAEDEVKADGSNASSKSMWKRKHFTLAILTQFLYVAAQTGIFSFFINYMVENLKATSDRTAAQILAFGGFGLFFLGRLTAGFVMSRFRPHLTLATYSFANVALMAAAMIFSGIVGAGALVLSFFFMSIMFPTIFALGIKGLGEQTKKASSFIVMAIVGGAIMPMLMGKIADVASMRIGFAVPLVCFVAIALYATSWQKLEAQDAQVKA